MYVTTFMQLQEKMCPFLSFSWAPSVPQERNLLSFDPFYIMHPKFEGIPTISDVSIDNSNIRRHFSLFGDPLWKKKSLPYLPWQRLWPNFGSPHLTGILQAIIPYVQLSSSSCFLCLFFSIPLSFPLLFNSHNFIQSDPAHSDCSGSTMVQQHQVPADQATI